jgi:hypothetical protein
VPICIPSLYRPALGLRRYEHLAGRVSHEETSVHATGRWVEIRTRYFLNSKWMYCSAYRYELLRHFLAYPKRNFGIANPLPVLELSTFQVRVRFNVLPTCSSHSSHLSTLHCVSKRHPDSPVHGMQRNLPGSELMTFHLISPVTYRPAT